jgi:phosphate starvation-inducible membrane PsiE
MQVQILTIFVWQCAGVLLLRKYRRDLHQPFTMWLYPMPALVALVMWIYVYATGPAAGITFSVGFLLVSVALYFAFKRTDRRTDV